MTAALLLIVATASAHPIGFSALYAELDGAVVSVDVDLHPQTVVDVLPEVDRDGDGELGEAEVAPAIAVLAPYLARTVTLSAEEGPCPADPPAHARLVAATRLKLELTLRCPAPPTALAWHVAALMEDEGGHTVLGRFRTPAGYVQHAFRPGATELALAARPAPAAGAAARAEVAGLADPPVATRPGGSAAGAGEVLATFVPEGVRHILGGADHLAFVLALVVVARRPRALAATITAFTLGHSLSLALSVLDVVRVSPRLVEPLIAASLVWVAVGNLRSDDPDSHRPRVALLFGVVHGFGFGSALREVGVPTGGVVPALVGFNVGVEVGQLGVVLAALPVLALARRSEDADRRLVGAVSLAVAALGAGWTIDRAVGLGWLPGA